MTTVASRTVNSLESLGILHGIEKRGRFGSLISRLDIYFGFLKNCATMVLKVPEEGRSVKRRGSEFGVWSLEFGVPSCSRSSSCSFSFAVHRLFDGRNPRRRRQKFDCQEAAPKTGRSPQPLERWRGSLPFTHRHSKPKPRTPNPKLQTPPPFSRR